MANHMLFCWIIESVNHYEIQLWNKSKTHHLEVKLHKKKIDIELVSIFISSILMSLINRFYNYSDSNL